MTVVPNQQCLVKKHTAWKRREEVTSILTFAI
jgi:hypothetical protein